MPQLAQATHRLHPAKDLLDELALLLTDGIAGMSRRASVDGAVGFLRHVRRDRPAAEIAHEGRDVESWLRHMYGIARQTAASIGHDLPEFERFWSEGVALLPAQPPEE